MQRVTLATLVLGLTVGCTDPSPPPNPVSESTVLESTRREQTLDAPEPLSQETSQPSRSVSEATSTRNTESVASPGEEPIQPLAQLLSDAMLALQSGDSDVAYRLARQAMGRAGTDPQTRFTYGLVLGERKRYPEAIRLLDQVANEMPQARLPALGQTADWMVKFGRYDEARARFESILELVPDATMAHQSLANLLLRQGRRNEAKRNLEFLCEIGQCDEFLLRSMLCYTQPFPGDAKNQLNDPIGTLGVARNLIANSQWTEAKKLLLDAKVGKDNPEEISLLARCHAVLMDVDSEPLRDWYVAKHAETSQNAGAGYTEDWHAEDWYAKGTWLFSQERFTEALRCFAQSVLLNSTDEAAYRRMAMCWEQNGDQEMAQQATARAEAIMRTHKIGQEFAESALRSGDQLIELIDSLVELRRMGEAACWRELQVDFAVEFGALTNEDAEPIRKEIQSDRERLKAQGTLRPNRAFLTLGLLTAE